MSHSYETRPREQPWQPPKVNAFVHAKYRCFSFLVWCDVGCGVGKINPAQLLTPPLPLTRLWQQEQRWRPLTANQKFVFPNSSAKITSRLCNANAHYPKQNSASVVAMALIWALWRVQKFNRGHCFRKCSTSPGARAVLTAIFVGLPTPARTANLVPVWEWTSHGDWRATGGNARYHYPSFLERRLGDWFRLLLGFCDFSKQGLLSTFHASPSLTSDSRYVEAPSLKWIGHYVNYVVVVVCVFMQICQNNIWFSNFSSCLKILN